MKLCKDCTFYRKSYALKCSDECVRPSGKFNPINGVEYNLYKSLPKEREAGDCGKDGKFFKKRKGFFETFFR